jgi:uncharacterized membrane protein YgcG
LPPHNGLTVAAAWQKGVIEPPTAAQLASYWLSDNRALVVAVLGLAFMLLYYAFAWLRVGRDPPIGTIIPMFGPPDGMSPAAARYVGSRDWSSDPVSFADHLGGDLSSTISSSSTAPGSSGDGGGGSGGGGSSGGGGGGGGGGGW